MQYLYTLYICRGKNSERKKMVTEYTNSKELTLEDNLDEIINMVVSKMNSIASLSYKCSKFLEPVEIKKIQESLKIHVEKSENIKAVKNELELFQEQIQIVYERRISQQKKERLYYEDQINRLETAKKEVMGANLSRMLWPHDERTKRFNTTIASLKAKIVKCNFKLRQLTSMRPAANEKDILVFQMQLKNKFAA